MSGLQHLKPSGKAIFKDRYVKKTNELLGNHEGDFHLIGAPLSKSSISHSGASFAPAAIRRMLASYTTYSIEDDIDLSKVRIQDYGDVNMHPIDAVESQNRIYLSVKEVLRKRHSENLILLGGDHSVTAPSVKAFQEQNGKVGIIQFDAHHDLRNLEDGGPTNGTPFRSLLESGIIEGKNLIQIGIRNFANGKEYTDYAKSQGITVYTMKDVRSRGTKDLLVDSLAKLEKEADHIYLSVDMDVLDQAFAPGCPAIGPGGMDSQSLLEAIEYAGTNKKVKGIDIVEIDPTLDIRDMTSRLGAWVLLSYVKGKIKGSS
ncbi:formimidoylglutamase [Metabacillus arenae]|uniref:Formimidoylglutamase n=1 Tax=Metabacillus arenae TaxID=2771434 RepID=A0A926NEC5_9BACI|nr:formimidoylglutamase [Metabacillus arenae]MBD1379585.1 formimidoylglutamase [Metabacillus arenae]